MTTISIQNNPKRPVIVCLCGSTRFMETFRRANLEETLAGRIVLTVGCDTKSDSDLLALGELTEEKKAMLDELHKRKIDLADEILVLNVNGYVGASTKSEIEYAQRHGKHIRWLNNPDTSSVDGTPCECGDMMFPSGFSDSVYCRRCGKSQTGMAARIWMEQNYKKERP